MHNLNEEILKLISSGKEGDHWDFKELHHENTESLIKDIVCLANIINYTGDRYIIFGVSDEFEIKGLENSKRRKQHEIIDILSQARFSNDIYLEEINLESKKLDILIIKDKSEKPSFLRKNFLRINRIF